MKNDTNKIKEAVKLLDDAKINNPSRREAPTILMDRAETAQALEILNALLEPEVEFYRGQAILTQPGLDDWVPAIFIRKNEGSKHPYEVIEMEENHYEFNAYADLKYIKPDPDFVPPGYIKKPSRNELQYLAREYVDKRMKPDESFGWTAIHLAEFVLSLWTESEGE